MQPGLFFASCDLAGGGGGGESGGPPSVTSKPLMLRSPKLHSKIYSSFPTYRYNLIDMTT